MLNIARRILKNTLFLSFTTVADRLAEVLLFLIMARAMGPGFVGDYKTVVMFLSIFQNLANFGLVQLVMREVSTLSRRDEVSTLLANYGLASLAISFGLLIIMVGSATLINYPPTVMWGIYIVCLALIPSSWRRVAEAAISGLENMEYIALVSLGAAIFRVVATLLLLWQGLGLQAIFWVLVATQVLIVPAYLFVIHRYLTPLRLRVDVAETLTMTREIATFLLMGILVIGVGTQIDILMIRKMTTAEEAGLYTAASTLVQALFLFRPAILHSAFPNMSTLYRESLPRFRQLTGTLLGLFSMALMPVPFATYLFADELMPLLLGAGFSASGRILQILIWIVLPSFTYATLSRVLVAGQQERRNLQIAGVCMVVNLALNLALIPRWAAAGAAVSSVVAMLLAMISSYVVMHRQLFPLSLRDILGKPILGVTIAAVAAYPLRGVALWASLPLLAIIYLGVLLLTGAIPRRAMSTIIGMVRPSARAESDTTASTTQADPS